MTQTATIWHIKRTEHIGYDEIAAMVVVASDDETEARYLAADNAYDEGPAAWLDRDRSTACRLGVADPAIAAPTVVIRDVYEA